MTIVRWLLARIILLVDFCYRPSAVNRDSAEQAEVNALAKSLTLYQYAACPFCVKVRWAMKRQGLPIATRDAKRDALAAAELEAEGGALKVPCLRIEENNTVTWMYESSDIIAYLDQRFTMVAEPS